MKKIFMVLFAALAVAAFVSSCGKDDGKKKGNNEGGGEEEEPALIAVDGDFADWDAIKDVTTIECPEDAFFPALKKAKLAADAKNIYAYIEYEPVEGQAVAPFEMIINADNDDETGGKEWLFKGADEATYCGYEYCAESENGFIREGKVVDMSSKDVVFEDGSSHPDGSVYEFKGPNGLEAWDDLVEGYTFSDDGSYLFDVARGVIHSAGVIEGGIAKVEISVSREDMEIPGSTIKVGLIVFTDDWETAGCLPQGPASGTTIGQADMQKLDL